ncbi:hypothetical protein SY88_18125 [Clostridiales bacterium PH28_bin88]|nr:hypothetical protein SY88_18125 [Clostridiales bacterium PH28_bin88]
MKVAVSAAGQDLDGPVDSRFGRCGYFIAVEQDTDQWEVIPNSSNASGEGAGIKTSQMLVNLGIKAVLTGNVGPKAMATLQAAGVKVYLGAGGTVRESLERYRRGELTPAQEPSVGQHHGQGKGASI